MKENKKNNHLVTIILCVLIALLIVIIVCMYINSKYQDNHLNNNQPLVDENENIKTNQENKDVKTYDYNDSNSSQYISHTDALEIALKSLNITKNDIYDMNNERDYKYGVEVYEIEFKYNSYEYEFYINAKTGEIIKSFKERD